MTTIDDALHAAVLQMREKEEELLRQDLQLFGVDTDAVIGGRVKLATVEVVGQQHEAMVETDDNGFRIKQQYRGLAINGVMEIDHMERAPYAGKRRLAIFVHRGTVGELRMFTRQHYLSPARVVSALVSERLRGVNSRLIMVGARNPLNGYRDTARINEAERIAEYLNARNGYGAVI